MAQTQKKRKVQTKTDTKLDLHGYTIEVAYHQCQSKLRRYQDVGYTSVEVVTGKSGQIRAEFPFWMENFGYRAQVATHGGSFIVYL